MASAAPGPRRAPPGSGTRRAGRRRLSYAAALAEAHVQALERDPRALVLGIGAADPKGIFGTTRAAARRFPDRVLEAPASEDALTGLALGAALAGLKPILVHARNDFMICSMDQLANHAANWGHMFGRGARVPMVVRAVVGRGWGQGPQHSQSWQAPLAHLPGLKVAMPSGPYEAKGLLLAALAAGSPVLVIEHRRLYDAVGTVPRRPYALPVGRGAVLRRGRDVSIVAVSAMVPEALAAAQALAAAGVEAEVVDPRWVRPLDRELILASLARTGRLVVADTSWSFCGFSAELCALAAERAFRLLRAPVARVTPPDARCPTAASLEPHFYPGARQIVEAALRVVARPGAARRAALPAAAGDGFRGPY